MISPHSINLVLRSALARVSKDGHKRDRASGHPSRRRFAPPQDEVCGLKLHPFDPIGFHGIDLQAVCFSGSFGQNALRSIAGSSAKQPSIVLFMFKHCFH
jgi:hypothetical protein